MIRLVLIIVVAAGLAAPAMADPSPQLTRSIAQKLSFYDIHVVPEDLTTAQAAALHLLLVSENGYLNIQRKARTILSDEDYRD